MKPRKPRDKKGSILVTCLWIMAILALFAMGVGFRASLSLRLAKYGIDKARARYLAKAGIVKACARIAADTTGSVDSLYACGVTFADDETPATVFPGEKNKLGAGSFSVFYTRKNEIGPGETKVYGVADEERRININMSPRTSGGSGVQSNEAEFKAIMKNLYNLMSDDVINSIMLWQGVTPSGMSVGADDAYYIEKGYVCKGKNFEYPEELKLVKGVTPDLYDAIKDFVTTYTDGKVNINTAPQEVLNALINDSTGTSYRQSVEGIVSTRKGSDLIEGTVDDCVFKDVGSVVACVPEDQQPRVSEIATKYFTFLPSKAFRIQSRGESGNVSTTITSVVERPSQEKREKVRFYHEE